MSFNNKYINKTKDHLLLQLRKSVMVNVPFCSRSCSALSLAIRSKKITCRHFDGRSFHHKMCLDTQLKIESLLSSKADKLLTIKPMLYEPTDTKNNYTLVTKPVFITINRSSLDSHVILDNVCIFTLVKSTNYQDPFLTALVKVLTLFIFQLI